MLNGKGLTSRPNPKGPNPTELRTREVRLAEQYVGELFPGTLATIDPPSPQQMAVYSQQCAACTLLKADASPTNLQLAIDNPVPSKVGDPSPIKHVIYIIRENRTYDQVMGDIKEGNGDPRLCLFGRHVTPNAHGPLVKQCVLLDNFYANAEVSAQDTNGRPPLIAATTWKKFGRYNIAASAYKILTILAKGNTRSHFPLVG